jgi:hypothetical protein
MGAAWKAFKVFLMVLGAIVTAIFLLFAVVSGALWFMQSQRFCHETVNSASCTDMIVLQDLIASDEKFRFRNVTENSEVAQLTTAYVGSSGLPTVKYTFVMRAKPRAGSDTSDAKSASKKSKEAREQLFAEKMTKAVCAPSTTSLRRSEAPNMQAFLKQGGAIEFNLKVADMTLAMVPSASLASTHLDKETATEIFGSILYTLGPVTITSCEDKP